MTQYDHTITDIVNITYAPIIHSFDFIHEEMKQKNEGHDYVIVMKDLTFTPTSSTLDKKICSLAAHKSAATRFRTSNEFIQQIVTLLNGTKEPPTREIMNALLGLMQDRNEDRLQMGKSGRTINANDELVTRTLGHLIMTLTKKYPINKIGRNNHWVPKNANHLHDIIEGSVNYSELEYMTRYTVKVFHQDLSLLKHCQIVSLNPGEETLVQQLKHISLLGQIMQGKWDMLTQTLIKIAKGHSTSKGIGEVCRILLADIYELLNDKELETMDRVIRESFLLDDSVKLTVKEDLLWLLSPAHRRSLSISALKASNLYSSEFKPEDFLAFTSVVLSCSNRNMIPKSQETLEREWTLFFTFMAALLSATEIEQEKHHVYVHALYAQYDMVQASLKEARTSIEMCSELYELFERMFVDILKVNMPISENQTSMFMDGNSEDENEATSVKYENGKEEENGNEVFCICRGPETGFMIQCSNCDEWYHGKCVNITEKQAKKIPVYICDKCVESKNTDESTYSRKKRKISEDSDTRQTSKKRRERKVVPKELINST